MRLTSMFLMILIAVFVLGCGFMSDQSSEGTGTGTAPAEESSKPGLGDMVVAKWTKNSFYEGKVQEIDESKYTIAWQDGSNATKVDGVDVFAMPKEDAKPDVAEGDIVLAKTGSSSYWNGAEIVKVDGDVYEVKTVESGATSNVAGSKIIKVPSAVAANLKEKAGSTEFLKAAQAKKPKAPSGFKAKKGDKVLAEWSTNSWWAGKVDKVEGGKTTVAWDDGSTPSAVDSAKVIPYPTDKTSDNPEEDQYLLVKPGSGTKWVYAQATAVGDTGVEIKTATGETRTVKAGEFVPLN